MDAGPAAYLPALTATPAGTRVALHIQPRASRTQITGLHGNALRVRLTAPPVDNAANDLLLRFLADRLNVPRSTLELTTGQSSRSKTVLVKGLLPSAVAAKLASD